jgi:hypothetical protein
MAWSMHVSLLTPFKQYTAADCPHYGDVYGPRCGGGTVPNSAPPQSIPPLWRAGLAPAPSPAQLRGPAEVSTIVGGTPTSAQLLLLQPLLTGTSVTVNPGGGR